MAVDDGLIGVMSQATQHAIALVWGALIGPWRDRLAGSRRAFNGGHIAASMAA
jgi:hypothetical protein